MPPATPADPSVAPLGHSRSAHRVFGWCAHCRDYGPYQEVAAWRLRESDLCDRYAAIRGDTGPYLQSEAHDYQRCGECGQDLLTVVTMRAVAGDGTSRPAGGWAICQGCGATPHPTMETAHG